MSDNSTDPIEELASTLCFELDLVESGYRHQGERLMVRYDGGFKDIYKAVCQNESGDKMYAHLGRYPIRK